MCFAGHFRLNTRHKYAGFVSFILRRPVRKWDGSADYVYSVFLSEFTDARRLLRSWRKAREMLYGFYVQIELWGTEVGEILSFVHIVLDNFNFLTFLLDNVFFVFINDRVYL